MCGKIKVSECKKQTIARIFSFLFIFFSLGGLFLLGVNLNTRQEKSVRERRMLEPLPRHFIVNAKNFEKYISDHIPLRDKLIDFYFESKLGIDFGEGIKIIGKGNYIFFPFRGDFVLNGLKIYQNDVLFDSQQLSQIKQNMQTIADFAARHNIKVYFTIPPSPARIYSHWMPSYILRKNQMSIAEQVENALKDIVSVVPLEKRLHQKALEATYPLVFKTDNHWSEDGAFEAYQILMSEITKDFPNSVAVKRSDFNIEYTPRVWRLYSPKRHLGAGGGYIQGLNYGNVVYRHYLFKKQKDLKEIDKYKVRISDFQSASPYRVYVIGDSFGCYFLLFLQAGFQHVYFSRYNATDDKKWGIYWKEQQKTIEKEKPDILIIAITDQMLPVLYRNF